MKTRKIMLSMISLLMVFVIGACGQTSIPVDILQSTGGVTTPEPTVTPEPTATPESTAIPVPEYYDFSVSIVPEGAGRLTKEKDGMYESGTEILVTVHPEFGYSFDGWYEDGKKVESSRSIKTTLSKNTHLKAVFIAPTPTPSIVTLEESKVGDSILFGSYEQDNDLTNGQEEIEWLVLKEEDGKLLLLSRYVLDVNCYHPSWNSYDENTVWEACYLRRWLNSTFYETAFSKEERTCIIKTVVETPDCFETGTDGGSATEDNVFLLSTEEVIEFYPKSSEGKREGLETKATEYALAQGLYVGVEGARWWLRSKNTNNQVSQGVGKTILSADIRQGWGVRPVIWLKRE